MHRPIRTALAAALALSVLTSIAVAEDTATPPPEEQVARAMPVDPTAPNWSSMPFLLLAAGLLGGVAWAVLRRSRRAAETANRSAWETVDLMVSAQTTASPTPQRAPKARAVVQAPVPALATSPRFGHDAASPATGRRVHFGAPVNAPR